MKSFNIEVLVCKSEMVKVEATTKEEAVKIAKNLADKNKDVFCSEIISSNNCEEYKSLKDLCREEVIDYINKNMQDMVDSHIYYEVELDAGDYCNKRIEWLRNKLNTYYKCSSEIYYVESEINETLSIYEKEYLKQLFIPALLKHLFKEGIIHL